MTLLVLVAGYAGSGKTTFAEALAADTGWALLEKDEVALALAERMLVALGADTDDRHTDAYRQHVRPAEYSFLTDAMLANVERGVPTIAVAPFLSEVTDPVWMRQVADRCATAGATVEVVWIACDTASMRAYVEARGAARDAWKLANWTDYGSGLDPSVCPAWPHHRVDNSLAAATDLGDAARTAAVRFTGRAR